MGQDTAIENVFATSWLKRARRAVGLSCLLCAMTTAFPSWSMAEGGMNADANELSAEELADKIVRDSRGNGFLEWKAVVGRVDILPVLLERMKSEGPSTKRHLVRMAVAVGSQAKPEQGRWCYSQPAARFLVSVLMQETNLDVRDKAAQLLVNNFPSSYIAPLAPDILKVVRQSQPLDERIRLLGKTGCAEARSLLLADEQFRKESAAGTDMALARLGDVERSLKFVKAYEATENPEEKARLAADLGYIGDASCVMALARSIRCPMIYERGAARVAVRIEIVRALGEVYPETKVFWVDLMNRPTNDSWYASVEEWLVRHLGVKWDKPRPPYFYSEIRPDPR